MRTAINAALLIGALLLLGGEIAGILRKSTGAGDEDTITEWWRKADFRLGESDQPFIRWAYRVFTIGILVWAGLHFLAGVE